MYEMEHKKCLRPLYGSKVCVRVYGSYENVDRSKLYSIRCFSLILYQDLAVKTLAPGWYPKSQLINGCLFPQSSGNFVDSIPMGGRSRSRCHSTGWFIGVSPLDKKNAISIYKIYKVWLVVSNGFNPSEKIQSVGMFVPNIWKNKTCSKPPTIKGQYYPPTNHQPTEVLNTAQFVCWKGWQLTYHSPLSRIGVMQIMTKPGTLGVCLS